MLYYRKTDKALIIQNAQARRDTNAEYGENVPFSGDSLNVYFYKNCTIIIY